MPQRWFPLPSAPAVLGCLSPSLFPWLSLPPLLALSLSLNPPPPNTFSKTDHIFSLDSRLKMPSSSYFSLLNIISTVWNRLPTSHSLACRVRRQTPCVASMAAGRGGVRNQCDLMPHRRSIQTTVATIDSICFPGGRQHKLKAPIRSIGWSISIHCRLKISKCLTSGATF